MAEQTRMMMLQRVGMDRQTWWSCLVCVAMLLALIGASSRIAHAATPVSGPVVVRTGGAQLYSTPGGDVVTTLPTGTIFTAQGRSADEQWIVGETWQADQDEDTAHEDTAHEDTAHEDSAADSPAEKGWLQTAQVIIVGIEYLPVVGENAAPIAAGATVTSTGTTTVTNVIVPASTEVTGTEVTGTEVIGTVASGDDRLNVRSGPGTEFAIVAKALTGESYPVIARSDDGAWLQIERGDGTTAWVAAAFITLRGDPAALPVVTAAALPATENTNSADTSSATLNAAPDSAAGADASTGSPGLSGTLVIESSPGGMIYVYALESGALWPLTNGFDPAISPDGQTVTFVRDGGENGIYLIDIDGSNERLIWSGRTRLSSPKWSPDGQWILFTRSDGTYHCLDVPGSCISPNGGGPGGRGFPAAAGIDTVTRYWYNLARIDRSGSNYRDIASLTSARAADWNEAGIVYQSNAGLQLTADVPDAENTLVIFDYLKPFFDDPDWQPHGGRIVYMGKEASHWELFAVNPDGSGKTALTRPSTTIVDVIPSNVAPAWSPDGKHIAFLSNREPDGEAGAWRVWVMDADGSNQRALPVELDINYTFGGEQSISWAP